MTILIGYRTPVATLLGCDSLYTIGGQKVFGGDKLMDMGWAWIGYAGPARLRTLAMAKRRVLARANDPYKFVQTLKDLVARDGWSPAEGETDGGPPGPNMDILIAPKNSPGLYWMEGSFSVDEIPVGNFVAVGDGAELAIGALAVTEHLPPEARVMGALEVAAKYNAYCGGDLRVRCIDGHS